MQEYTKWNNLIMLSVSKSTQFYTYRFKCHNSLKIHDGAVPKSMIHAFIDPVREIRQGS